MKTLNLQFVKKGWTHRQIERIGKIAIYERTKSGISEPHYEVVIIRERKAWEKAGVQFPASETYPSAVEWGKFGWTHLDLVSARRRFNTLTP